MLAILTNLVPALRANLSSMSSSSVPLILLSFALVSGVFAEVVEVVEVVEVASGNGTGAGGGGKTKKKTKIVRETEEMNYREHLVTGASLLCGGRVHGCCSVCLPQLRGNSPLGTFSVTV